MTNSTIKASMTAAALALVAAAAPVSALQDAPFALAPSTPTVSERAQQLKAEAEQLYSQPRQWRRAVRLLEQSAQMRTADDPGAYSCWLYASRLRAALGDYTGARQNLEKAADHAIARGALIDAAHALIDAAHVAVQDRQPQHAQTLVDRAALLASSPLLDAEQAHQITARIKS